MSSTLLMENSMARDYKAEQAYDGSPAVKYQGNFYKDTIDGKDIDHKTPLSKGGTTVRGNLAVKSASANRSYKRNPDGSMK